MAAGKEIAKAMALHRAGKIPEAERCYRRILAEDPEHSGALHLLGVVLLQKKDYSAGKRLIQQSLESGGPAPERLVDLGSAHWSSGELDEAETAYRSALQLNPSLPSAWSGLAGVLRAAGRYAEAIDALRQSVHSGSKTPRTWIQLASLLAEVGDYETALQCFQDALRLFPGHGPAAVGVGQILLRMDRVEEAGEACRDALAANPRDPDLLALYGETLLTAGRLDAAEAALRQSLAIRPRQAWAWFNLGRTLIDAGRLDADFLLRWLSFEGPPPGIVRQAAIGHVKKLPACQWFTRQRAKAGEEAVPELGSEAARALVADPVLRLLASRAIIDDLELESVLTDLRRAFLLRPAGQDLGAGALEFLGTLAAQCFSNEFVYYQTASEGAAADRLRAGLEASLTGSGAVAPEAVALMATYMPLHRLAGSDRLPGRRELQHNRVLQEIFRQQIIGPREEMQLARDIPSLTDISDPVSRTVRDQYEQNPYPRWREIARLETRPIEAVLTGLFPYLRQARVQWPRAPRVLVAGCGTGRQSITIAQRFANCTVKAVDLSLASLAYAKRKTLKSGLTNIDYAQGDILELRHIGERFDVIECTGVLHHLADPLAGWRVLRDLLAPGGFMKIGLYSETGRVPVVAARELIRDKGFPATPDGMREARRAIGRLDPGHPARRVLDRPDFYSMSTCRDLIFHVQEHRLDIPTIASWLSDLKLDFLGFEPVSAAAARDYRQRFPDDETMRRLENWDEFEHDHPSTFAGMYMFWTRDPGRSLSPE